MRGPKGIALCILVAVMAAAATADAQADDCDNSVCATGACGTSCVSAFNLGSLLTNMPLLRLPDGGGDLLAPFSNTSLENQVTNFLGGQLMDAACGALFPALSSAVLRTLGPDVAIGTITQPAMIAACSRLPVADTGYYIMGSVMFPMPTGGIGAVCTGLRPCGDRIEVLMGFNGVALEITVPVQPPLGVVFSIEPTFLGWYLRGNGIQSSGIQLWDPSPASTRIALAPINMRSHLRAGGAVRLGLDITETVAVTVKGVGEVGINYDALNDGVGGIDHSVLLKAEVFPELNFMNGMLTIGSGGFLGVTSVVYWQVATPEVFKVRAAMTAATDFSSLMRGIRINGIPVGAMIDDMVTGIADIDAEASLMVSVDNQSWGILLYGQFVLRLGLPPAIKRTIDEINDRIKPAQLQDIVPLLKEIYAGWQVKPNVGIAILGDAEGDPQLGLVADGNILSLPFCSADNDLQCGPGHVCWGILCVPLSRLGGPCTTDKHCGAGRCGEDVGALWCVQCTNDDQCGAGEFCERNPVNLDGRKYLACHPKQANGAYCDRPEVCVSQQCLGLAGTTKCGNCTDDADCGPGTWCDNNPSRLERGSCRPGLPDGVPCNRDSVCASGQCAYKPTGTCGKRPYGAPCSNGGDCVGGFCNGFCRNCFQDSDCEHPTFCERNPTNTAGVPWMSCRDCLLTGDPCDRSRPCCSGRCMRNRQRNPFTPTCD